jgi:hypothetical protein
MFKIYKGLKKIAKFTGKKLGEKVKSDVELAQGYKKRRKSKKNK